MVMVLHEKTENMKLGGTFNLRGALAAERMVYQAKVIKKIDPNCQPGIQDGLNEIAKTQEFIAVLEQEVVARRLVLKDVTRCIALAYDQASKHAQGNDSIITLREQHHTANQLAVLAAFLRVQTQKFFLSLIINFEKVVNAGIPQKEFSP
ncbi:hypothetical protein L873DRAFT_1791224 [Choiromyces venosus 120613-1]|uniref:Uncharacterized protein n=1 Tax=Choiromyces venosus 120613-1 TaxID=1336337 RepID=A0A3N4JFL4_9PEZI|nr:hypothetical protein L873DRAFT_1791224 [Choiromyces venosus 120613-1]